MATETVGDGSASGDSTARTVALVGCEHKALAHRLMARLATDWADRIDWEDVPYLAEGSWQRVADEMDELARWLLGTADDVDRGHDIDSRHLFEQATNGSSGMRDGQA